MKTGFIIPARLASKRLPKKLLINMSGRTVLEWVILRAKAVKNVDEVVVATTDEISDSIITKICVDTNTRYYIGDAKDVIKRIKDAAIYFDFDFVINITPDNPLFSIYMATIIAERIKEGNNADFIKVKGLPIGSWLYCLKREALQTVCDFKSIIDTEVWGPLISGEIFNVEEIQFPIQINDSYRLTLDTKEDFEVINDIYTYLQRYEDPPISLVKAVHFMDNNPVLAEVNKEITQKPVPEDKLDKIHDDILNKKEKILQIKTKYYGK